MNVYSMQYGEVTGRSGHVGAFLRPLGVVALRFAPLASERGHSAYIGPCRGDDRNGLPYDH